MKVITLRQPLAWAALNGMTTINIVVSAPVSYRGPLAIHAGVHLASPGTFEKVARLLGQPDGVLAEGAVIGVVDLHHAHLPAMDQGRLCCDPWGERPRAVDRTRMVHLRIRNPRPVIPPVATHGQLGLWTPDEDLAKQILSTLAVT